MAVTDKPGKVAKGKTKTIKDDTPVSDVGGDESFESKLKTPGEYCSQFEYETQKKLEEYYKADGGKLTEKKKVEMVELLKASYDSAKKEDRGNVLVPESAKDVVNIYYNEYTERYDVGYNWGLVDTVPESRKMKIMRAGEQFDRVGPPSGRCVGEVNADGTCASRKQRSIPYHFTETDITQEPSYHRYVAKKDFTKENLLDAIENSYCSDKDKSTMTSMVQNYYDRAPGKYGKGDGLQYGEIAPMFEETTGSTGEGYQYDMPLSMDFLIKIRMIREIKK